VQQQFRFLNALARPDDSDAELTGIFPIGVAIGPVCREACSRINAPVVPAKNKFRFIELQAFKLICGPRQMNIERGRVKNTPWGVGSRTFSGFRKIFLPHVLRILVLDGSQLRDQLGVADVGEHQGVKVQLIACEYGWTGAGGGSQPDPNRVRARFDAKLPVPFGQNG
jgi:hypothetical protein